MKLGGMQLSRNAVLEWRNRECGRSMDQSDGTEVPVTKVQDSRNLPPPSLYAGALALSTGSAGHIANLSGSVQETSLLALEQATVIAAAAAHASLQCGKQFKWWQPDTYKNASVVSISASTGPKAFAASGEAVSLVLISLAQALATNGSGNHGAVVRWATGVIYTAKLDQNNRALRSNQEQMHGEFKSPPSDPDTDLLDPLNHQAAGFQVAAWLQLARPLALLHAARGVTLSQAQHIRQGTVLALPASHALFLRGHSTFLAGQALLAIQPMRRSPKITPRGIEITNNVLDPLALSLLQQNAIQSSLRLFLLAVEAAVTEAEGHSSETETETEAATEVEVGTRTEDSIGSERQQQCLPGHSQGTTCNHEATSTGTESALGTSPVPEAGLWSGIGHFACQAQSLSWASQARTRSRMGHRRLSVKVHDKAPLAARHAPHYALLAARELVRLLRPSSPADLAMNVTQSVTVLREPAGTVRESWTERGAALNRVKEQRQAVALAVGLDHTAVALSLMPAVGLSAAWRAGRDYRIGKGLGERDAPYHPGWMTYLSEEGVYQGDGNGGSGGGIAVQCMADAIGAAASEAANALSTGSPVHPVAAGLVWESRGIEGATGRPSMLLPHLIRAISPYIGSVMQALVGENDTVDRTPAAVDAERQDEAMFPPLFHGDEDKGEMEMPFAARGPVAIARYACGRSHAFLTLWELELAVNASVPDAEPVDANRMQLQYMAALQGVYVASDAIKALHQCYEYRERALRTVAAACTASSYTRSYRRCKPAFDSMAGAWIGSSNGSMLAPEVLRAAMTVALQAEELMTRRAERLLESGQLGGALNESRANIGSVLRLGPEQDGRLSSHLKEWQRLQQMQMQAAARLQRAPVRALAIWAKAPGRDPEYQVQLLRRTTREQGMYIYADTAEALRLMGSDEYRKVGRCYSAEARIPTVLTLGLQLVQGSLTAALCDTPRPMNHSAASSADVSGDGSTQDMPSEVGIHGRTEPRINDETGNGTVFAQVVWPYTGYNETYSPAVIVPVASTCPASEAVFQLHLRSIVAFRAGIYGALQEATRDPVGQISEERVQQYSHRPPISASLSPGPCDSKCLGYENDMPSYAGVHADASAVIRVNQLSPFISIVQALHSRPECGICLSRLETKRKTVHNGVAGEAIAVCSKRGKAASAHAHIPLVSPLGASACSWAEVRVAPQGNASDVHRGTDEGGKIIVSRLATESIGECVTAATRITAGILREYNGAASVGLVGDAMAASMIVLRHRVGCEGSYREGKPCQRDWSFEAGLSDRSASSLDYGKVEHITRLQGLVQVAMAGISGFSEHDADADTPHAYNKVDGYAYASSKQLLSTLAAAVASAHRAAGRHEVLAGHSMSFGLSPGRLKGKAARWCITPAVVPSGSAAASGGIAALRVRGEEAGCYMSSLLHPNRVVGTTTSGLIDALVEVPTSPSGLDVCVMEGGGNHTKRISSPWFAAVDGGANRSHSGGLGIPATAIRRGSWAAVTTPGNRGVRLERMSSGPMRPEEEEVDAIVRRLHDEFIGRHLKLCDEEAFVRPQLRAYRAYHSIGPQLRREAMQAMGVCDTLCPHIAVESDSRVHRRSIHRRGNGHLGWNNSRTRGTAGDWRDKFLWYAAQCGCGARRGIKSIKTKPGAEPGADGMLVPSEYAKMTRQEATPFVQDLRGDHDEELLASGGVWLQMNVRRPEWADHTLPSLRLPRQAIDESGGVPPGSVLQLSAIWPGAHVKPHCGPHNMRWRLQVPIVVPCYSDCDSASISYDGPRIRVDEMAHGWDEHSADAPTGGDGGMSMVEAAGESLLAGRALHFDDAYVHEVDAPLPPGGCTWGQGQGEGRKQGQGQAATPLDPIGRSHGPASDSWLDAAHLMAAGLHALGGVSAQEHESMPCSLRNRWTTRVEGLPGNGIIYAGGSKAYGNRGRNWAGGGNSGTSPHAWWAGVRQVTERSHWSNNESGSTEGTDGRARERQIRDRDRNVQSDGTSCYSGNRDGNATSPGMQCTASCAVYPQPVQSAASEGGGEGVFAGRWGWDYSVGMQLCIQDDASAWAAWVTMPRIVLLTDLWPATLHMDENLRQRMGAQRR